MPISYSGNEAASDSYVKPASNYDVIDEVYQGIDDFEARLGQLKG